MDRYSTGTHDEHEHESGNSGSKPDTDPQGVEEREEQPHHHEQQQQQQRGELREEEGDGHASLRRSDRDAVPLSQSQSLSAQSKEDERNGDGEGEGGGVKDIEEKGPRSRSSSPVELEYDEPPRLSQRRSLNRHTEVEKKIKAPRMTFRVHTKSVLAVTVLHVGDRSPLVVSGGEDKHLVVSSLATGNGIVTLEGHVQKITAICTTECKGRVYLVSCSWDETVRCWPASCLLDVDNDRTSITEDEKEGIKSKCLVLRGHRNRVYDVAALRRNSPDPLIASASADNTVRIWSVYSSHCLHVFTNDTATWNLSVGTCLSKKQGPLVIVGCKSSDLKVWGLPVDIKSKDYLPAMHGRHDSGRHDSDGRERRGSRSEQPTSRDEHALDKFRLVRTIVGHPSRITDLCVYNPNTYYNDHGDAPPEDHPDRDPSDHERIKTISNIKTMRKRFSSGRVTNVAQVPVVATACRDLILRLWSIETGQLLKQFHGNTSHVHSVFIQKCPDGEAILLNTSTSGNIRIWDLETGELRRMLSGHTDEANGLYSFTSPENNSDLLVVSSSNDWTVRFWTFKEERSLTVLQHNTTQLSKTRVSEVAIYLETEESKPVFITGCTNGSIYGWSLGDDLEGDLGWIADVHRDQVTSLALYHPKHCVSSLTPAAKSDYMKSSRSFAALEKPLVISGGRDNVIHVRDLFTGEAVGDRLVGHSDAITSVVVYSGGHHRHGGPMAPFIASSSEDNDIRLWSLESRVCLAIIQDHDFDVTSLAIYAPLDGKNSNAVPPSSAITRGSKVDDVSQVQSLLESSSTEVLASSGNSVSKLPPLMHTFSQTKSPAAKKKNKSVRKKAAHFSSYAYQQPITHSNPVKSLLGSSVSHFPEELLIPEEENPDRVVLVSASMDGTVRLYSPDGDSLHVLAVEKVFFSFVTVMNSSEFPLMAASTLSGQVYVWGLEDPYPCLHVFSDHTDEVRALSLLLTPSRLPVLMSGSWDTTIRVYNLNTFRHTKTIEGQRHEITAIAATSYGGNEPIIASASSDGTVNIYFDFLSSAANKDVVMIAFDFDIRSARSDDSIDESWPRISGLVKSMGPKSFFIQHYELFFKAICNDQASFLVKFLHISHSVLLKTNISANGSLLYVAMQYRDVTAVREIVKCWISFLTKIPRDSHSLIYYDNAQISKDDLLLLSFLYPEEFELLISSLVLIPVPNNDELRVGTKYLNGDKMYLGIIEDPEVKSGKASPRGRMKANAVAPVFQHSEVIKDGLQTLRQKGTGGVIVDRNSTTSSNELLASKQVKKHKYYFLPLPGLVDINMLRAYTITARSLDSFKIFDSIAGKMCQRFVWRVHGRVLHVKLFKRYIMYVFFSSLSIYIFPFCIERQKYWPLIGVLLGGQIMYDMYYIYSERRQFMDHPLDYLKDVWNRLDALIIVSGLTGNIIRLVTSGDTLASRVSLSIFSISLWFNFLYFLRAFERTGPLVSMIYHIFMDIRALLLVLVLVCVGFSQAFWLLSNTTNAEAYNFQSDYPFSSIKMSFVNSFSYMLGNFESDSFAGLPLENFAIVLSCFFMLIVAILLLNLLIALMGDTYGYVSSRGLAQWRLEQLDYVVENSHSKSENVMELSKYTLYFATLHDEDKNLPGGSEGGERGAVDDEETTAQAISQLQQEMHELKQMMQQTIQKSMSSRGNSGILKKNL